MKNYIIEKRFVVVAKSDEAAEHAANFIGMIALESKLFDCCVTETISVKEAND